MNNPPQCPFCQTPFETVDLLTLHLIFDMCSLQVGASNLADPAGQPQQTATERRSSAPELVPES